MLMQTIEYQDGTQKLIGELIQTNPDPSKERPAIIIFHAFEGRSEFTINYAKELATKGFIVLVADVYGDKKTSETIEGCFALITPFLQDRSLVRRRAVLAYEALLQQPGIAKDKIGAVGFCFGGMCVLELARSGTNLKAGVSMHGVLAKSDLPTHPIKSHLLILHGYEDPQIPPSCLEPFGNEMKDAGVKDWTFVFFGDGKHSFTDPKTGTFDPEREIQMGREYNKTIADRSFRYAVDFFSEIL